MGSFEEKKFFLQEKMGSKEFRLLRPRISQLILDIENAEKENLKRTLLQGIVSHLEKLAAIESQKQYLFEKLRDSTYKPVYNELREMIIRMRD